MSGSDYGVGVAQVFYAIVWIALIIAIVIWCAGLFDSDPAKESLAIGRASLFFFIALIFSFIILITFGFMGIKEKMCAASA